MIIAKLPHFARCGWFHTDCGLHFGIAHAGSYSDRLISTGEDFQCWT
jgi:hypothetical protein